MLDRGCDPVNYAQSDRIGRGFGLCKSATECLKFAFHLSVAVERWRSLNKLSLVVFTLLHSIERSKQFDTS